MGRRRSSGGNSGFEVGSQLCHQSRIEIDRGFRPVRSTDQGLRVSRFHGISRESLDAADEEIVIQSMFPAVDPPSRAGPPDPLTEIERVIGAHPVLMLNLALLMGVTLGWLVKRR